MLKKRIATRLRAFAARLDPPSPVERINLYTTNTTGSNAAGVTVTFGDTVGP